MEDSQIIELYNSRIESAINETAKKYGKLCFLVADNILHDKESSDECVNDTYLKTWDSIPPQLPRSLRAFLCTITRNLALDRYKIEHAKRRGGNETQAVLDEIENILPTGESTESEIERRELTKIINSFLKTLSERDRFVFMRRYYFADAIEVIAQKAKLSEANVHKILSRSRMKLKEMLEEEGVKV